MTAPPTSSSRSGQPQPVLQPLTRAAIFLVATVDDGGEAVVNDALGDLSALVRSVGFRDPSRRLSLVASIGSLAWDRLFSGPRPAELHPFAAIDVGRHVAPSTPGDLLFHIRAESMDFCFELARYVVKAMAGAITVVDEVHGFQFFDNRDLMGFVDGTENPGGASAVSATQIGDEDPEFAGGCYVHVQRYLHNLDAWNALSVAEQERAIGRTKLDDIEFPDDQKAANSHLALNVIEDDEGNELKIVRRNMPFGEIGTAESGTYYIGYCRTPSITERMLDNMFVGDPPGNTDRILDFSTAVTGSMFFTPTVDFLDDPPPLPEAARKGALPSAAPSQGPAAPDSANTTHAGSLAIGSLKGKP